MNHIYIAATIVFAIASQLIIRWQVGLAGELPVAMWDKALFIGRIFLSPWVMLAFVCTFLGGISWMMTLTKFDLSYAYPFTSLTFVIMLVCGALFFEEPLTLHKLVGTLLVVIGLIIVTRG